ncbi:hypothetical protein BT96DRAFT_965714 [Gymnopus androsaceus JB14]|uniref:RING-type E3 ubiquitin transferase n=1 Tax=Gymnopus androsaceus JB14 TaxID=1447944 RepID=A0A6A4HN62_9AGAR|nr:hypothetical protein BT96DRAFT_965714 [Gymnopus androsaceus JB14]
MQEAEEQDTCRICSAPAEPDQPLFHPCKCSGTIRYIHQDCLTTWLAHSKKKTCDVCKHPYSFTKVYAADMPSTLPPLLMIRRLIQQGFYAVLMIFRAIVVSLVWLAIVPLLTVWSWRVYFSMGDSTAWWISDRQSLHPRNESSHRFLINEIIDLTQSYLNESSPPPAHTSVYNLLGRIGGHPAWVSLSADIFTGQIIAALIVITFVAIFLLREWIAQNARPGVFDDDDNVGPEILQVPPGPQVPPAQPAPRPAAPRMDVNARLALAHRQIEAVRALDALRVLEREERPLTEEEERERELRALSLGRSAVEFAPVRSDTLEEELDRFASMRAKRRTGKGKEKEADADVEIDEDNNRDIKQERMQRRNFARRLQLARAARQGVNRRRQDLGMALPSPPPETSSSTPTPPPATFFPTVALERPNGNIPFSFVFPPPKDSTSTESSSSLTTSNGISFGNQASSSSSMSSFAPTLPTPRFSTSPEPPALTPLTSNASISRPGTPIRRPPLPTTLPTTPGGSGLTLGSPVSGPSSPRVKTPLESPSLATYRAPEELADFENNDYFASSSTSTLSTVGEQTSEEEEDEEDSETEHGESIPLLPATDSVPLDDGEADVEWYSTSTSSAHTAEEENDDSETLDGHDVDEEQRVYLPPRANGEMEMDWYFPEEEEGIPQQDNALPAPPPLPEPPVMVVQEDDVALGAEDEDEEEEEDDDDDDDGEDEAGEAGPGLRRMVAIDGDAPGALQLAPVQEEALMIDDMEAAVEDDMDGAMEAIGLRGPVLGLLQNAGLMIFIMDTVIGLGIWIPYTIGKTAALLLLKPRRLLFILHLPIRAIRIVTDPAVDSLAYLITDILIPPYLQIVKTLGQWVMQFSFWIVSESLGEVRGNKVRESCFATYSLLKEFLEPVLRILGFAEAPAEQIVESIPESVSDPSFISQTLSSFLDLTEPHFSPIGREVRQGYAKLEEVWIQLAVGDGAAERIFAVLFGYCIFACILAIYLNLLTVGNVKTAGRAVRSAVRQQLLVLKVATFIFIELVTFPLGCGVVLDLCTLWLFPKASYASRMEFLYQAPLTTVFYHWVAGTMFMYSFALLLSGCRSIMRPGAMWFIKDPQDQNAHPIRDILDRPSLVQLRKICVSGVMYSFVVMCTICSVAVLLLLGRKMLLPFRWKTREPLSNVPIDLLFLNLALPYTMTYFRPRKPLKRFTMAVWKGLAKRLRLTSYFFGKRHGEEEYTPKTWSLSSIIYGPSKSSSVLASDYDGSFKRVPNTDDIAIPREMRATASVTATGEPFDDAARILIARQDAETIKASRSVNKDFAVVYIPPQFRYRMIFFVFIMWSFAAFCLGVSLALPILLGRAFFGIVFKGKREVHDGYSIIAGFYMLWVCWIAGRAVDRLDKRRQRWGTEGPRGSLWWLAVKRGLVWFVKASYMAVFLGIIIPPLVGGVVELYMILPFKLHLNPDLEVPRIRILDCWAAGLLYMKIVTRVSRRPPYNPISRGIEIIKRNGWTHPDPVAATKDVFAPVTGGLLGMIFFPAFVFYSINFFFPLVGRYVDEKFLFTYVYSSLFCLAGLMHTFILLRGMLASWSQAVRDKEFLVEMRLKNHEPVSKTPPMHGPVQREGEQEQETENE